MKLKISPIKINPDDPFAPDLLNRREEIENLTVLLDFDNSPMVLALNSKWGTGKTSFIKMWKSYLNNQGYHCLYFNAWTTDFSHDPLLAFIGEINVSMGALLKENTKTKKAWLKAKKAGQQIVRRGVPALVKIGTAGIVDTDKIIEEELAEALALVSSDLLEEYAKQKEAIHDFRESLQRVIKESKTEKPVIIFVDELDRCRPDYSVSLLERIKHLFDINGLIFVLGIDKQQLCNSTKAVYGSGLDSEGYLRRFIDFEYSLKDPDNEAYVKYLCSVLYSDAFFESRQGHSELRYERGQSETVFLTLADAYGMSLREIEQTIARFNLVLGVTRKNQYLHAPLVAFLVVLREREPEIYQRYLSKENDEREVVEYLHSLVSESYRWNSFGIHLIEGFLIKAKVGLEVRSTDILEQRREIAQNDEAPSAQRNYAETVINIVEHPIGIGAQINLDSVRRKLELIDQFDF